MQKKPNDLDWRLKRKHVSRKKRLRLQKRPGSRPRYRLILSANRRMKLLV